MVADSNTPAVVDSNTPVVVPPVVVPPVVKSPVVEHETLLQEALEILHKAEEKVEAIVKDLEEDL